MVEFKVKATEVQVSGTRVVDFVDKDFAEELQKSFPGTEYVSLIVFIPKEKIKGKKKEKPDIVHISHANRESWKKKILSINCENSDTLQSIIDIIKRMSETKGGSQRDSD